MGQNINNPLCGTLYFGFDHYLVIKRHQNNLELCLPPYGIIMLQKCYQDVNETQNEAFSSLVSMFVSNFALFVSRMRLDNEFNKDISRTSIKI